MFLFLFLYFSMLLLFPFSRLKELFQVKNVLTTSLLFSFLFFCLEIPKMWVGRTTLNGEKEGMALGSDAPTKKYKNTGRREHWLFAQTKGGKMLPRSIS